MTATDHHEVGVVLQGHVANDILYPAPISRQRCSGHLRAARPRFVVQDTPMGLHKLVAYPEQRERTPDAVSNVACFVEPAERMWVKARDAARSHPPPRNYTGRGVFSSADATASASTAGTNGFCRYAASSSAPASRNVLSVYPEI